MSDEKLAVFERQEFESVIAYKAFRAYLESQDRNIDTLATAISKNKSVLQNWFEKYDWESRAAMYDFLQSQAEKANTLREQKKMTELQISLGRMLQASGAKALQGKDLSDEPVTVILKAIELGVQIERTARNIEKKTI